MLTLRTLALRASRRLARHFRTATRRPRRWLDRRTALRASRRRTAAHPWDPSHPWEGLSDERVLTMVRRALAAERLSGRGTGRI